MSKITAILGSIRFWQVVVVSVLTYLSTLGVVNADLAQMVNTILGVSVVIGTADSIATKIGNK